MTVGIARALRFVILARVGEQDYPERDMDDEDVRGNQIGELGERPHRRDFFM